MANWTNTTKNTSSFSNQAFGIGSLTWNLATFSWDEAGSATWDTQRDAWSNLSRNSSSFTNQTKN